MVEGGGLAKVVTAFSREHPAATDARPQPSRDPSASPDGYGPKMYVQRRILEHADLISHLVREHGAYVYVCGATGMAREVRAAMAEVLGMGAQGQGAEAVSVEALQESGRFLQDVWG